MFEILLIINTFEILLIINTYFQIIDWLILIDPETFYFPIFLRSPCVYLRSHIRSVRAHRSQRANRALTVRSLCVHKAFTLCSSFVQRSLFCSIRFHSFSFRTPLWKKRSYQFTRKWEKNTHFKLEENLYYTLNIISIRIWST